MKLIHSRIRCSLATIFLLAGFCSFSWSALAQPAASTSSARTPQRADIVGLPIKSKDGQEVFQYLESHALLIGVSEYKYWNRLDGVKQDIKEVSSILKKHGFKIDYLPSPKTGDDIYKALKAFFANYGHKPNNRLIVYYSGHGATLSNDDESKDDSDPSRFVGYLVPTDAPLKDADLTKFRELAFSIKTFRQFSEESSARHIMFVFDSCFSGWVLDRHGNTKSSKFINNLTAKPVREFITAGTRDQTVPDDSIFRRKFVESLEGKADKNRDGYVTGTELADYVKKEVVDDPKSHQNPQWARMDDAKYREGDFVFVVPKEFTYVVEETPPAIVPVQQVRGVQRTGKDYALLIATDNYQNYPSLRNPVHDAQTIASQLRDGYGFETELLLNPTRLSIIERLRKYRDRQYSDEDQLFIFFAGMGYYDAQHNESYMIASDSVKSADLGKTDTELSAKTLALILDAIPNKHILLMVDAPFGGGVFTERHHSARSSVGATGVGGDVPQTDCFGNLEFVLSKMRWRTRRLLTLSRFVAVQDGLPGEHSPFAAAFLKTLRNNGGPDGFVTIEEIVAGLQRLKDPPVHGGFGSNEPGSNFFFFARKPGDSPGGR